MDTPCLDPNKIRRSQHQTLTHQHESWGNIRADLIRRTGLERQETAISFPGHIFLMNLKGAASRGEDFVDGRRISFSPRRAGSVIHMPAGSDWTGWDEGEPTAAYLLVSIEKGFTDEAFAGVVCHRSADLPASVGFRDSTVEMALQRIAIELRQPDPISVTMVESQAMHLLVQMVRRNGHYHEPAKGGLSAFDLKRAIALIESSSDETPTLADLAKEVGVSRFHFSRAFKQSTGMTPHAYIARRRLDQSADMLRSTNLSATEIALECGFGSSSHFTIAFKRAFGASPTEYRRRSRI
ncbi:helix-turn-helix transcriptional regulator [Mesorhizobium sp. B2-3-13]|nr:helix-turn-helix transcriptional regulator [Mesorhizobium sp. B2-6-5]TPL79765.1 helix-turn-helix transcriptional regulator [Mesorhizobium sp. B2-3-13]